MFSLQDVSKGEPIVLSNFSMDSSIGSLVTGTVDSFLTPMFDKIQVYHTDAEVVRVLVKPWGNDFFDCFAFPIIPRAAYHDCGEYGYAVPIPDFWDKVAEKASAKGIEVFCPAEGIYRFTRRNTSIS